MKTFFDYFPDSPDATATSELEILRLGESPTPIIAFCTATADLETHYHNYLNLRGEFACNRRSECKCLCCDLREKPTARVILPVYDVATQTVKAMLISKRNSPTALGPQIRYELAQGNSHERLLLITRISSKFTVESIPLSDACDRGESVISRFMARLEAQAICLEQCVPVCCNSELWDVPEIERKAMAMGLARSAYLRSETDAKTNAVAHMGPPAPPDG